MRIVFMKSLPVAVYLTVFHGLLARLEVFRNQTVPVLDYYNKAELVERIDGRASPDDVFTQIRGYLDARK